MKYRKLGKTGMKVSVIGIGTWQFGGEWGKTFSANDAASILNAAKEEGINLIDTAECYGDHMSERLSCQFRAQDRREDWSVATKFGHHCHENFNRTEHWTAAEVEKQLDASLKALQTDYIDLYQFHSGNDQAFDNDELWTMLHKQMDAGKIRHLGISISKKGNLHQTDAASSVKASVIQAVYNRLDRQPEDDIFPSCARQNLGVLARVPLASGFLSGKYKPGATFQSNDVRNHVAEETRQQRLELAAAIRAKEVPANMDMTHWALAWCLKHNAVTAVIPGCKSVEQVKHNTAA